MQSKKRNVIETIALGLSQHRDIVPPFTFVKKGSHRVTVFQIIHPPVDSVIIFTPKHPRLLNQITKSYCNYFC